ncbi:MAG: (2Fe-2S)-binding protein [Myxococcales bacterium]|nr:(2Fe-2S)-binding protein [Myxococcales bacterium]
MSTQATSRRVARAPSGDQQVVVYINGKKALGVRGETLLDVADRAGGWLDSQCLAGACGTCVVRVVEGAENLLPAEGVEAILLEPEELRAQHRLGCQARLAGDVRVESLPGR